jgi:hypothetical protein
MRVGILTNLNSRKNRSRPERGAQLQRVLGADGLVRQTRHIDEIRPVLEEFIDRGVRYWVSDGGDGTLHWMLNEGREVLERRGLMRDGTLPLLVPTNGGTIDFVARKAGITGSADSVIDSLLAGVRRGRDFPTVEIDSLEVLGHRPGDAPGKPSFRKIGFAVAVGGLGQRFFRLYYQEETPGPWAIIRVAVKGAGGYLLSLPPLDRLPLVPAWLREYGQYLLAGTRAHVVADGRDFGDELYQGLHAGAVNIDFGTVKLFRYAQQPRRLHLVVGVMSQLECTYKWVALVLGVPVPGKRWHEFPGEWMEIEARGEPLAPVIDGEVFDGFDWLRVQLGPKVRVPLVTRH